MTASFGLTLYTLAGRRDPVIRPDWPDRPRGRLVWLHAPAAEHLGSSLALARRLIDEDGLPVLLTTGAAPEQAHPAPAARPAGLLVTMPPADTPAEALAFLEHFRPEVGVFIGGELRPALIHEAQARRLPLLMADARAPHLSPGRGGWYPGLLRSTLPTFRHVIALDQSAAQVFCKAGAVPACVLAAGRMEEDSAALPHVEADRAALALALATRPIWLAVDVPQIEEAAVITAHREALRLSHRLLLILAPQDPSRTAALAARLEAAEGWSVAQRGAHQDPDSETTVYLPDAVPEFGLWYRLAPVTFLGGSLLGKGCSRNPLEPAALGSAIIHGPRVGPHGAVFGRLAEARAARMVASAGDLVQALGDLLSPDRAARQAQAAWGVASEGADVTVQVVGLIRAILEGDG